MLLLPGILLVLIGGGWRVLGVPVQAIGWACIGIGVIQGVVYAVDVKRAKRRERRWWEWVNRR